MGTSRVVSHPYHPEQRSVVCGFESYCLVDDMCNQYGSGLYCDIVNQCCFPKVPNGGPCPLPGIGGAICQSGNCGERFPFWKIFLWPPAALSECIYFSLAPGNLLHTPLGCILGPLLLCQSA